MEQALYLDDSLNVASVTDNGTGNYSTQFSNAICLSDYSRTCCTKKMNLVMSSRFK